MARWVSFDELKTQVSISDVLRRYGLLQGAKEQRTQRGTELRLRCPFHEDKTPSFSVNVATGRFHCFGCHAKGGDILDFVVLREEIDNGERNQDRRQAALKVQEWFGVTSAREVKVQGAPAAQDPEKSTAADIGGQDTAQPTSPQRFSDRVEEMLGTPRQPRGQRRQEPAKEKEGERAEDAKKSAAVAPEAPNEHVLKDAEDTPTNPPLTFTFQRLDHRHPYLLKDRGLAEATIDHFGVGYHAGRGIMHGRVVIPIHNTQGELVAYAGRWPGDEGWPEGEDKYKLPQGFHKSLVLFNLHRAKEYADEGLIVVEGFFSVFEFWQRGRKNVVALMGSAMSEAQERLIVETVGPKGQVLLALDADEAGRRGSADAVQRLVSQVFVREIAL